MALRQSLPSCTCWKVLTADVFYTLKIQQPSILFDVIYPHALIIINIHEYMSLLQHTTMWHHFIMHFLRPFFVFCSARLSVQRRPEQSHSFSSQGLLTSSDDKKPGASAGATSGQVWGAIRTERACSWMREAPQGWAKHAIEHLLDT